MEIKLGDAISKALAAVGVTEERVSKALGRPCGCKERREKLNRLSMWALRVVQGKTEKAEEYLDEIIGKSNNLSPEFLKEIEELGQKDS